MMMMMMMMQVGLHNGTIVA